ncbi:MAG TPA: AmmeMemoRadiSam system radical SAM enzyme [bacterium]|nr:AmmeMemoRadiSam system radical SAM enzyme [bacterium]
MKEALYYTKLDGNKAQCGLCPHNCIVADGKAGFCRVRSNRGGVLYSDIFARVTSYGLDPIEKKPLYHFHPGRLISSFGTKGCNLSCAFCQNYSISQDPDAPDEEVTPSAAVRAALRDGSFGIAYTYTEPMIWFEYVLETARLARAAGLRNVLVTNGLVNEKPLRALIPYVDAMNVDVKSMDDGFYRKVCSGMLAPVLKTVELAVKGGCHVEVTNLVIPTLNDAPENFEKLRDWLSVAAGDLVPLHFSRYFPMYKLDIPPTPVATLEKACAIAREKLKYVYVGNAGGGDRDNTLCPACGNLQVQRRGYSARIVGIKDGKCAKCGRATDIVGV